MAKTIVKGSEIDSGTWLLKQPYGLNGNIHDDPVGKLVVSQDPLTAKFVEHWYLSLKNQTIDGVAFKAYRWPTSGNTPEVIKFFYESASATLPPVATTPANAFGDPVRFQHSHLVEQ